MRVIKEYRYVANQYMDDFLSKTTGFLQEFVLVNTTAHSFTMSAEEETVFGGAAFCHDIGYSA